MKFSESFLKTALMVFSRQNHRNSSKLISVNARRTVQTAEMAPEKENSRHVSARLRSTSLRHRNQPFKTMLFDNYSRSEAALISTMSEMFVQGVSTRKVTLVIETQCGTSVSKSAVSEVKDSVNSFSQNQNLAIWQPVVNRL